MSDPQRAIETAIRANRLFDDADLQNLLRLPATDALPEGDLTITKGMYVATPLHPDQGRRLWRVCRGIRTPANPNAPGSRIMTLPLPRMRCLEGDQAVIQAPIFIKDAFAPDEIHAETLDSLIARERDFVAAQTTDTELAGLRRARVLDDAADLEDAWRSWIRQETNLALGQLGMNEPVAGLEIQFTVHGDGGYYRLHRDVSDNEATETRILTFVYYVSRQPRPFSGGQLKLYDYTCVDGVWRQADTFRLIEPEPNRLILFPACFLHEVLPVQRHSEAFADGRFTVNGWVHRQP